MSTHVTRAQLDCLREGTLRPAEIAEVGRHAASCDVCAAAVAESYPVGRVMRDLRAQVEADAIEHLPSETLFALADGTARDDARAHLEECAACRAEVDEIVGLKRMIRPRRQWPWYAAAASIAAITIALSLVDRTEPNTPPPRNIARAKPAPVPQTPAARGYARKEWDQWVATVRERRKLPVPDVIEDLRPHRTRLRGASDEDDLRLQPNGTVVLNPRPKLQWARVQTATYQVILQIGDRIIESGLLDRPEWSPAIDLQRGGEYAWQVEVTAGGVLTTYPKPPDPPARFRVLDQKAFDEIDEARMHHPDDALLQTVLLARHGVRQEALDALDRLDRSDPQLAGALRESLLKWPS